MSRRLLLEHLVPLHFRILTRFMFLAGTNQEQGKGQAEQNAFAQPRKPSGLSKGERESHRRRHSNGHFASGARRKIAAPCGMTKH